MIPMSKTIQITFNADGTTEIKTIGFRGNSCMKAAEFLKKALGSVLKTKTPEYFQAEAVQTAKARGSE
jgi:fatty acid/phospholipid biosynthesis enzyme